MSVDTTVAPISQNLMPVIEEAKWILEQSMISVPDVLFQSFEQAVPRSKGFRSALGRTLNPSKIASGVSVEDISNFRWAMQEAWAELKN